VRIKPTMTYPLVTKGDMFFTSSHLIYLTFTLLFVSCFSKPWPRAPSVFLGKLLVIN